jgi:hypothetical protein
VSELNNNRIQVFDSSGTFIRKWGSNGSDGGQFSYPSAGVSIDKEGLLYICLIIAIIVRIQIGWHICENVGD